MSSLGIARAYRAVIHHRGGVQLHGVLDTAKAMTATRMQSETSTATVTLAKGKNLTRDTCRTIATTAPWTHELSIYRDTQLVWQGPVVQLKENRAEITLEARDVSAWLDVRTIHQTATWEGDLATIAHRLLLDAFGPDDPGAIRWIQQHPTGITASRTLIADTVYAGQELRELAKLGLAWTTIGHRIILTGRSTAGPLRLTGSDILGDIEIERLGNLATRVIVQGDGVTATEGGPAAPWGLLEAIIPADGVTDPRQVRLAARAAIRRERIPPIVVRIPDGARLAPTAPIGLDQLIPGALLKIVVDGYCTPTTETLRLHRVTIDWTPTGEAVSIAVLPPEDL